MENRQEGLEKGKEGSMGRGEEKNEVLDAKHGANAVE